MHVCVCVLGAIIKIVNPRARRATVIDVVAYADGNGRRRRWSGRAGILSPASVSCSKVIGREVVLVVGLVETCTVPLEDEKVVHQVVGIRARVIQRSQRQDLVSPIGGPIIKRIGIKAVTA